jgi:hypothetical protein
MRLFSLRREGGLHSTMFNHCQQYFICRWYVFNTLPYGLNRHFQLLSLTMLVMTILVAVVVVGTNSFRLDHLQ